MESQRNQTRTLHDLLTDLRSVDRFVRQAAVAALKDRGTRTELPALIDALLTDADEWVRIDAAEALGNIGDPRAIPALLVALKSEALIRDWQAAWAQLPTITDQQLYNQRYFFLWQTLVVEISDIRFAAAHALSHIGDEIAIPGLLEAWHDPHDRNVREAAEQALKQIGTPNALAALTKYEAE